MKKLLKAVWGFIFVTFNVLLTVCGGFLAFVCFTDWARKDVYSGLLFLSVAIFAIGMLVLHFGIKVNKPVVQTKKQNLVAKENWNNWKPNKQTLLWGFSFCLSWVKNADLKMFLYVLSKIKL